MAGFELNSAHKFEIDTAQDISGTASTYERVAAGINTFDPQWNEEIDQTPYFDGDGFGSSDVTSAQLVIAFEGHRKYGDAAQDFIAGLQIEMGEARKTNFRWTEPDGGSFEGWATIANIVAGSGAANEKSTFSFEVHFNGKPTYAPPTTGA
ncbi:phage tail tube protein [Cytobacillus oceanisediminis]|uniref:phage tail tube protein n=1 Tax=Cytobacillus oceanisediminis TaxID=665099 RepID=UPI001C24E3BF|nr:capsid protein [Cytobacillus oceanisediminis]MBU8768703.1 capsid protein [Cytobacillus oceanisediminis]